MTWVIGRAGLFGHAIGLSDIRITLSDGREFDCLQKIHLIGRQLVLGFAGSVALGLKIVSELSAALAVADGKGIWDPEFVAEMLPIGTRKLFESFPEEEKKLGCHLLLLSAHPTKNDGSAPWARCYVHRFYSPNFKPLLAQRDEIVSIGSGSDIQQYKDALKALGSDMKMFEFDVHFPGGSGIALMSSLTALLKRNPSSGISRYLHLVLVGRDRVRIGSNGVDTPDNPEINDPLPQVAQNMDELTQILGKVSASELKCAVC